eukprot:1925451-Amphidinium_carterae.2
MAEGEQQLPCDVVGKGEGKSMKKGPIGTKSKALPHGAPQQVLACFHSSPSLDELTAAIAKISRSQGLLQHERIGGQCRFNRMQ